MGDDILGLLSAIASGGPLETIGRDEVGGLTVSTVLTSDQGYETALLDEHQTSPVERYQNQGDALDGHRRWIEQAKTITAVTKLGYGDLIADKVVVLARRAETTGGGQ